MLVKGGPVDNLWATVAIVLTVKLWHHQTVGTSWWLSINHILSSQWDIFKSIHVAFLVWSLIYLFLVFMMMSSNGNNFRVTGSLCGEFAAPRWIRLTKASDAELWGFLWYVPWINGWVNNREAGDLRRHRAHYDVIVIYCDANINYSWLILILFPVWYWKHRHKIYWVRRWKLSVHMSWIPFCLVGELLLRLK